MSMTPQREDEELVEVIEKFNMLNVIIKDLGKAINVFVNKTRQELNSLKMEIEGLKKEMGEEEKVEKEETTM